MRWLSVYRTFNIAGAFALYLVTLLAYWFCSKTAPSALFATVRADDNTNMTRNDILAGMRVAWRKWHRLAWHLRGIAPKPRQRCGQCLGAPPLIAVKATSCSPSARHLGFAAKNTSGAPPLPVILLPPSLPPTSPTLLSHLFYRMARNRASMALLPRALMAHLSGFSAAMLPTSRWRLRSAWRACLLTADAAFLTIIKRAIQQKYEPRCRYPPVGSNGEHSGARRINEGAGLPLAALPLRCCDTLLILSFFSATASALTPCLTSPGIPASR